MMEHVIGSQKFRAVVTLLALSGSLARTGLADKQKTAKEIYDENCKSCHKADGTGNKPPKALVDKDDLDRLKEVYVIPADEEKKLTEPRRQPDFTDPEWKKRREKDKANGYKELIDIVKNGKKVTIKAKDKENNKDTEFSRFTRMPGTSDLTDDEIKAVLDYIGTLEKPKK